MASSRICSVEGCGKRATCRGWCNIHYQRWIRHGEPTAGQPPRGIAWQFLNQVALCFEGDNCLLWPFARNDDGYGIFGRRECWTHSVGRYLCQAKHGRPPSDCHEVAHNCGVRACCNPSHLRWATHAENVGDREMHGTVPRGEDCGRPKLNREQVRTIRLRAKRETLAALGREFGVSRTTVLKIVRREKWAWLD